MFVKIPVCNINAIFFIYNMLVLDWRKERKRSNTWFEFLCADESFSSPPCAGFASYGLIPHYYLPVIFLPPGFKPVMLNILGLFLGHLMQLEGSL